MNKQNKIESNPNTEYKAKNYEKIGYKVANKIHRYAVLTMVGFISLNIVLFFVEYNRYWRERRRGLEEEK
jgi:hypothetical protein